MLEVPTESNTNFFINNYSDISPKDSIICQTVLFLSIASESPEQMVFLITIYIFLQLLGEITELHLILQKFRYFWHLANPSMRVSRNRRQIFPSPDNDSLDLIQVHLSDKLKHPLGSDQ